MLNPEEIRIYFFVKKKIVKLKQPHHNFQNEAILKIFEVFKHCDQGKQKKGCIVSSIQHFNGLKIPKIL